MKNTKVYAARFTSKYDFKSILAMNLVFIWENSKDTLGAARYFLKSLTRSRIKHIGMSYSSHTKFGWQRTSSMRLYLHTHHHYDTTRIEFSSVYIASNQNQTHKKIKSNTFEVYVTSSQFEDIHQKGHSLDLKSSPEKTQALKDLFVFESPSGISDN